MLELGLRLVPGVTLGQVHGRVPPSRSWPAPAMELELDLSMSGSVCVRYLHRHGTIACMPDRFRDEASEHLLRRHIKHCPNEGCGKTVWKNGDDVIAGIVSSGLQTAALPPSSLRT